VGLGDLCGTLGLMWDLVGLGDLKWDLGTLVGLGGTYVGLDDFGGTW
jgi:hypothetical protein